MITQPDTMPNSDFSTESLPYELMLPLYRGELKVRGESVTHSRSSSGEGRSGCEAALGS